MPSPASARTCRRCHRAIHPARHHCRDAVLTFAVASDAMSDTELSWFVDLNVMREISGVDGVGAVRRIGGVSREVRVDLDPDRMAALGCDSRRCLQPAGAHAGGTARRRDPHRLPGAERAHAGHDASVQELAALPITLGDGRNIRLDSIADVRDQAAEIRQEVRLDGRMVIGFEVMRAWGEGALKVADGAALP